MIYYKNNQWHISNEEITYTRDGEVFTQAIGQEGKQWWLDFEDKWDDMEIIEFKDIEVTDDELQKLEEINSLDIKEGHHQILEDYIFNNKFPELPNHILKDLQFTKIFNIMLGVEE